MRRTLSGAALWAVIALAAVGGGVVSILVTGAGGGSIEVLTPAQVDAALDEHGAAEIEPKPSSTDVSDGSRAMTTVAGTVTVTCVGDVIAAEEMTPAAGWDVGDRTGDNHRGEVRFTTDQPMASTTGTDNGDVLIVAYRCDTGEATWDSWFD